MSTTTTNVDDSEKTVTAAPPAESRSSSAKKKNKQSRKKNQSTIVDDDDTFLNQERKKMIATNNTDENAKMVLFKAGANRRPFIELVFPDYVEALEEYDQQNKPDSIAEQQRRLNRMTKDDRNRPYLLYQCNMDGYHSEHRRNFNMLALGTCANLDTAIEEADRIIKSGLVPKGSSVSLVPLGLETQIRDTNIRDLNTMQILANKHESDPTAIEEMRRWTESNSTCIDFIKQMRERSETVRRELLYKLNGDEGKVDFEMDTKHSVFDELPVANLPVAVQEFQRMQLSVECAEVVFTDHLPRVVPTNIHEVRYYN